MKKAIIRHIIIIVAVALLLFMAASIFVFLEFNQRNTEDNALTFLSILETGMFWQMVAIMILVLAIVMFAVFLAAPKMANNLILPISLIKEKLDKVGKPEETRITLTEYDEINQMLLEIDKISESLHSNLMNFQNEKINLNLIMENINFAVLALDPQNKILLSNRTAKEYFNFKENGVSIHKIIRDLDFLDYIKEVAENKQMTTFDIAYVSTWHVKHQAEILEIKLLPVKSNIINLIITAQNVTDIRKLHKEKQDFFVNASHELRTPLSSILGYAEILKKEEKYKPEFVDVIYKQASRMQALIGDMLQLSELEEGGVFTEENINLKELAKEIILMYKLKAENKNISLSETSENISITANKEKITEVISNLIDNAIKYTNKGGKISLTIEKKKNRAVISVKDNGIGIAQEHLSRICERFYRTDKGRSRAEGGTGLGLAIVKHICNHYNASLIINSKENAGTEVVVEFVV